MKTFRIRAALALVAGVAGVTALLLTHRSRSPSPAAPPNPPLGTAAQTAGTTAAGPGPSFSEGVVPSGRPLPRARSAGGIPAEIAAFTDWLTAWRRADLTGRSALVASGRELAIARRAALKQLIATDPRLALEVALPAGLRAEMPAEVVAQLERPVDARGDLEVNLACLGAVTRLERIAIVDGRRLEAFVYGRRERQTTKFRLPVHGIAVDGALAFAEAPYRLLDDTEKANRGIAGERIGVLVGDQVVDVDTAAALDALHTRLVEAESQPGPRLPEALAGAANTAPPATAALTSPPSWINGTKRVLWIKIDFADDPGAAYPDADLQASGTAVNEFYVANSQGKTSFTFTILPEVLRMPRDKAYYSASGSTNGELYTAARDAAKAYDAANGGTGAFDPERFDRYLILHKRIPVYLYGGVAQLGGPRVGLNNAVSAGTVAHELGHSQSLYHSHYWLPAGTTAVGAGAHVEYGDVFDIMGGGGITQHFNVAQKSKLGYLDDTGVTTISQTGTYRIARHDHRDSAGLRGLRIAPADLGYEYWIEHRQLGPTSLSAAQLDRERQGVLLHWGTEKSPKFTTGVGTYLVDATAGSAGGAADAPARIGEAFVDADAGLTIKPLAVSGSAPGEYIDVRVSFGAVDGNHDPVLQVALPPGPWQARTNLVFNASATDADGDALYYRWDFGDGSLQPNLNSLTRRFVKGGDYTLRVSAHDGKGGIATKTLALNVADPLLTWTRRNSGTSTQTLYDVIFAGERFVAIGLNQTILTSPDGITWTRATFPSGNSLTGVAHNGTRYVVSGYRFSNTTQKGLAAYSEDGATWTLVNLNTGLAQFWAIAHGAGRFVMVGDAGTIYYSPDGVTWSQATSGISNTLRTITYADGLFVATGDGGRALTSTDGITWLNRSLPTTATFYGVARHNNLWQLRSGTAVYTSPDTVTWTRTTSNATSTTSYRPLSVAGVFLVGTANGLIEFAENQQTWASVRVDSAPTTQFRSVTSGRGLLVAVANNGLIYSADLPPASTPPIPAPTLRLEADSIKVAVGKKNVLSAAGPGFVKLELYANGAKVSELAGSAGALTWTPATVGNYVLVVRGIDAAGASVASAAYPAVAAFADWRWLNPAPVGVDLRGAVRAEGKWWMVGGGGTLLTLDDAGNFIPVDFPTTQALNGIAYASGRFVIATTDLDGATKEDIGGVLTSTNGYTWTPFLTGALDSANLNAVLYAADRWIGLGTGGTVVTSTDGINWPRATSGITQSFTGATTGQGLIVAVAAGGKIVTSTDGLVWAERTSGVTTDLRAVTHANGTFVAVGNAGVVLTSPNGTTWTRATSGASGNLYGVAFVKGAFVVGGDSGTVLSSADGASWTPVSLAGNASGIMCVASGDGEGLMIGRAGEVYTAMTPTSWRRLSQGTVAANQGVIHAGGRFVAVGASTDSITRAPVVPVQVSTDGLTWRRAEAHPEFSTLNAIAYGQERYVAVGPSSAIFTSTDGTNWTKGSVNITVTFTCIAAGPEVFVAASSGQAIYSSANGNTWSQRAGSLGAAQRGVAYGNGRFVVVGDSGQIRHSTNGTNWTVATSGVTTNLLAVGWWEEVGFIATGATGTILHSPDGIAWQPRESGVAENLAAITRTPIGLVAAGGTQGTALISIDGVSWSVSALPVDKTIRGLAANSSTIVAAGDNGALLAFPLVDSTPAPVIVAQPLSRQSAVGEAVQFGVSALHAAGAVYQWQKDGAPIHGANNPVYTIPVVAGSHAGAYTVTITSPNGVTTSAPALLGFGGTADPGRLVNLSILTALESAADSFTFGVVVGGDGTSGGKALLVRAAGPSLIPLGVAGALEDPRLEFFTGPMKVGENDNWGGAATTSAVMARVGAFPFASPTSRDSALSLPSLSSGAHTAKISGTGAGLVLAELYDATARAEFTAVTPRLINVSVLKQLGSGLTAGFVVGGASSRTVLIRAIGPTLGAAPFGVAGVVGDPQLALFTGSTQIGANDNWGGGPALAAAFAQVGAFALPAASRDAALLVTLQPGSYTVQVTGAAGTTGLALVEVYEVP